MTNKSQGFPAETLTFLRELSANNSREWFQANKKTYEAVYKSAAKAFCAEMESQLTALTGIPHTSKVFRINRDLRFSKDKTPYNNHLHISFIPEGHGSAPPCWFFGLAPDYLSIGTGLFAFDKQSLETYRSRVDGKPGEALSSILARLGCEPNSAY